MNNWRFLIDWWSELNKFDWLQGSVLEMRPEKMKAFDQDVGINASIQFAWNGGDSQSDYFEHFLFLFFFLSIPKESSSYYICWCYSAGAGYDDFELDANDGSVRLRRHLRDNEMVQPVTLVVKVTLTHPLLD